MTAGQVRRIPSHPFEKGSATSRGMAAILACAALVSVACTDKTTEPVSSACDNIQNMTIGVTVNGTLASGDCLLPQDNSYADTYRFVLTAPTEIQFDLVSDDFATFLILNTPTGANIDFSGEGGEDDNARLTITLAAGTYHILANSFAPGETGDYQLISTIDPG